MLATPAVAGPSAVLTLMLVDLRTFAAAQFFQFQQGGGGINLEDLMGGGFGGGGGGGGRYEELPQQQEDDEEEVDLYERLGLEAEASTREIKSAYRKMSVVHHPDKNGGGDAAIAKFREITEAYEILSDPEKRVLYDHGGIGAARKGLQAQEEGALERLHHAVLALCFLTECPRVRASVRRRAIPAKDAVWVHRGAELGKVLDGVHLTACEAGEAEASAGVTGGQAGKGLWAAVPWALTGVPRTLNAVDVLEGLEGVGCGGWRDWAGCLDMATAGDWVKCWTWQRLRIPPSVWCLHDRSLVRVSDTLSAACAPPRLQAT